MPKLTYCIENAPGKIYGRNSNELVFREPSSRAVIYSTATASDGLLRLGTRRNKKQLFRGAAGEGGGAACVATLDEPAGGDETLEMHRAEVGGAEAAAGRLRIRKTSSWVPLAGGDRHAVAFRGEGYTWSGRGLLRRDRDGRVVARVAGAWFWQGKLGDMEVDVPEMGDEQERRGLLEMVLATFVARWWGEKVAGEARAKEARRAKEEAAREKTKKEKQKQKQKAAAVEGRKKEEEEEEQKERERRAWGGCENE